ncbi:MAG TPA: ABC transporter permease [Deinococcales bacterium]|nr:ABC transporter permease [Deinococcales bacterium]
MLDAIPFSFLLRRLASAAVTLILATVLVFAAQLAIPGDPARLIVGMQADAGQYQAVRHSLGLDLPPLARYLNWLAGLARLDFGTSIAYSTPVGPLIASRLPVTVPLVGVSSLLALLIAVPAGSLAARHRGRWSDLLVSTAAQAGLAIPSFWLGLLLMLWLSVSWQWLPSSGFTPWTESFWGAVRSLTLPVLALALGQAAGLTRMVRSSVLDVSTQDFVRTARSKGVPGRRVWTRHVLRNAWLDVITLLGVNVAQLLGGSLVVEAVFNLPGLGALGFSAVRAFDYPVAQGVVVVVAAAIVAINLLTDVLYTLLDPRIRFD